MGDAEEELLAAADRDAVPEDGLRTPVNHDHVDDRGEKGTISQQLERSEMGLFTVKYLPKNALAGAESH